MRASFDGQQASKIMRALERMPFNLARKEVGKIMQRAFRPAYNTMRAKAPKKPARCASPLAQLRFFHALQIRGLCVWVHATKGKTKVTPRILRNLGCAQKQSAPRAILHFRKGWQNHSHPTHNKRHTQTTVCPPNLAKNTGTFCRSEWPRVSVNFWFPNSKKNT